MLRLLESSRNKGLEEKRQLVYDWLIAQIDNYDFIEGKDSRPLNKISPRLFLRKIVTTPNYNIELDSLKNFLVIDIMGIYPQYTGNFGWKYIQKRLRGEEDSHSYDLDLDVLDKYFDIQQNKIAFTAESAIFYQYKTSHNENLLQVVQTIEENNAFDIWVPYLLLRDIQGKAREYLGKYYAYYMEHHEECENELGREEGKRKYGPVYEKLKSLHKKCVMAVLLQEIFVNAILFDQQRIEAFPSLYLCHEEFWQGLLAEMFILMIFESVFLQETNYKQASKADYNIEDIKKIEKGKLNIELLEEFSKLFTPNSNRSKVEYKDARVELKEIFEELKGKEVCEYSLDIDNLFEYVKVYLSVVSDKKLLKNKEVLYHLWVLQTTIASWNL